MLDLSSGIALFTRDIGPLSAGNFSLTSDIGPLVSEKFPVAGDKLPVTSGEFPHLDCKTGIRRLIRASGIHPEERSSLNLLLHWRGVMLGI